MSDNDIDFDLNRENGKTRAKFNWRAGMPTLLAAYFSGLSVVLLFLFAIAVMLFGYELNFKSGDREVTLKPPRNEPSVAQSAAAPEAKSPPSPQPKGLAQESPSAPRPPSERVPQRSRIASQPPTDIRPKLEQLGRVPFEILESQGSDKPASEPHEPGAYYKDGLWYIIEKRKCERYGSTPTFEACFYSPNSPGGRPIVKE